MSEASPLLMARAATMMASRLDAQGRLMVASQATRDQSRRAFSAAAIAFLECSDLSTATRIPWAAPRSATERRCFI